MGYPALRALLDEHGITVVEVEMLNDWCTTGEERRASDTVRQDLLDAAAALRARHIKAGGHIGAAHPVPWEVIVTEFAKLGRQAADRGTRVAFEPMPFTDIPDLATGRRLVDQAGEPACGLMIDLWHVNRAGTSTPGSPQPPAGTCSRWNSTTPTPSHPVTCWTTPWTGGGCPARGTWT